jgi:hypothetical protein
LGVAALSAVLGAVGPSYRDAVGATHPNLAAYHVGFLVAGSLTLVGALVALRIRDRDAAATLLPREPTEPDVAIAGP